MNSLVLDDRTRTSGCMVFPGVHEGNINLYAVWPLVSNFTTTAMCRLKNSLEELKILEVCDQLWLLWLWPVVTFASVNSNTGALHCTSHLGCLDCFARKCLSLCPDLQIAESGVEINLFCALHDRNDENWKNAPVPSFDLYWTGILQSVHCRRILLLQNQQQNTYVHKIWSNSNPTFHSIRPSNNFATRFYLPAEF